MTYRVVQKVKGNHYLYEVESTWDPVKKSSRQTRRYIGKCDEDGNLVGKAAERVVESPAPVQSKSFGQYYLMLEIARDAGIVDALERTYGAKNGRIMAGFFLNRAVRPGPPSMSVDLLNECFLPEMLGIDDMSDWSTLRKMLINLGAAFNDRHTLFRELADGGDAVVYELMSLAESFTPLETVRGDVGYGFSGLPKIKVSLGFSGDRCFYFAFTTPEESDASAMSSITADLRGLGMRGTEFFLRPRVFNEREVSGLMSSGIPFSAPLSTDTPMGRRLMAESSKALKGPLDTFVYRGSVYRVYEKTEEVSGGTLRFLVYINEKRRNDEVLALYSRLEELESAVASTEWSDSARRDEARTLYSDVLGMFDIAEGEDGMARAVRRRNAISAAENKCGKTVVMTTTSRPWNDFLDMLDRQNESEFYIRQFRLDLEEGARYFASILEGNGSFIQEFAAIAVRNELRTRLAASSLRNRISPMEAVSEMGKLKVTRVGDRWVLNEMSPLQKTILTELGVEVPTDATVNGGR
ncbi:MAG: hypothetical protein Q4Q62_01645 [Thermoplasmata archaeon]|nr:hypothetical protein [Thermoplasmata archaeon]